MTGVPERDEYELLYTFDDWNEALARRDELNDGLAKMGRAPAVVVGKAPRHVTRWKYGVYMTLPGRAATDELADDIAAAVLMWAGRDRQRLAQAIDIITYTRYLDSAQEMAS
jgi:hypothetical protein